MTKLRTSLATVLAQIPAARAREARDRRAGKRALSAHFDRHTERVIMELSNGCLFGFPARALPALANASAAELDAVEVLPGGSGLHWEALDADYEVAGLLLASVGRRQKLSELARIAGATKSKAKAAAARLNGAKGGRPKAKPSRRASKQPAS